MPILRNNLPKILQLQGVTQETLAARSGVTQGYISQLCNGYSPPNVTTALRISHALGVLVEDIWQVGEEE